MAKLQFGPAPTPTGCRPAGRGTANGVVRSAMPPSPICPEASHPHAHTLLVPSSARLWFSPDATARIRWRPGTFIVWDNRFLQHCGIHDYENERRHLVRTTVIGEKPV